MSQSIARCKSCNLDDPKRPRMRATMQMQRNHPVDMMRKYSMSGLESHRVLIEPWQLFTSSPVAATPVSSSIRTLANTQGSAPSTPTPIRSSFSNFDISIQHLDKTSGKKLADLFICQESSITIFINTSANSPVHR